MNPIRDPRILKHLVGFVFIVIAEDYVIITNRTKTQVQKMTQNQHLCITKHNFYRKYTPVWFEFQFQILSKFVKKSESVEVVGLADSGHALDADGQVLRHESGFDSLHASVLQGLAELSLKKKLPTIKYFKIQIKTKSLNLILC